MRKLAFMLALVLLVTLGVQPAMAVETALPFEISAQAAYLINLNTGKVVYERNADERRYPASTTKLMTCIMVMESGYDLDTTMVTAPRYIYDEFVGKNVSTGDIRPGETLSLRELLYAMLLQSANEAASIVADFIGDGSMPYFAELMTKRAKELGCTGTNFTNPHGLFDENHYSTARDMAIIAEHAISLPGFKEIAATTVFDLRPTEFHQDLKWITTNYMMRDNSIYYYEPVNGLKTGTLDEAGRCFVSTASQNGYDYLCVVLGSKLEYDENGSYKRDENGVILNEAFADTKLLYEWAYSSFSIKTLMENGTEVTEVPLKLAADLGHMKLASSERFTALVPDEIEATSLVMQFDLPSYITAPVKKGEVVGQVRLILMDEEIGRVPLLATQSVPRSEWLYLLEMGKLLLLSFWFKFATIFLIVFIVLYTMLMMIRNRNMQRYKAGGWHKPKNR